MKALCNGKDGSNGVDSSSVALESIASSSGCPNGGVKLQSGSGSPIEICNGANGLNGEQGIQGIQGIPGMAGAKGDSGGYGRDGTIVTPVEFCDDDKSTYPEYGLIIGEELFAAY